MVVKTFSEESVKRAEAAHTLGFDTVKRFSTPIGNNPNHTHQHVMMRNVKTSVELDPTFFPEIFEDEEISVLYIMHFEDCNRLYKEHGMYQPKEGE